MTPQKQTKIVQEVEAAISLQDVITEIQQAFLENLSPAELYEDDDTPLHDWAVENGYVLKEGDA